MSNLFSHRVMAGIIGVQEIVVFISFLLYVGIPVILVTWFVKSVNKINNKLDSISKTNAANEIEKLFELKGRGIITQQEFDNRKAALLR